MRPSTFSRLDPKLERTALYIMYIMDLMMYVDTRWRDGYVVENERRVDEESRWGSAVRLEVGGRRKEEVTLAGACPMQLCYVVPSQIRKERGLTWKERSMQSGPAALH
ncbi:uncharacterized protein BHQ10_008717 [Talaromyces amestolkiae]|uniref:Uncharacterized protein n=1 Tax=Talaromyces amestolkiae TaxID=1196081 RepID=A0A364LA59_TALAM|nr:uncharacterized protein BHQ10_008717 [Talaromyces amestolkiae]RAO72705.1 hypothetical protein BHQ10_008717 [Talaromyces amestolkiae]